MVVTLNLGYHNWGGQNNGMQSPNRTVLGASSFSRFGVSRYFLLEGRKMAPGLT
jgi:hypothetical protein